MLFVQNLPNSALRSLPSPFSSQFDRSTDYFYSNFYLPKQKGATENRQDKLTTNRWRMTSK